MSPPGGRGVILIAILEDGISPVVPLPWDARVGQERVRRVQFGHARDSNHGRESSTAVTDWVTDRNLIGQAWSGRAAIVPSTMQYSRSERYSTVPGPRAPASDHA